MSTFVPFFFSRSVGYIISIMWENYGPYSAEAPEPHMAHILPIYCPQNFFYAGSDRDAMSADRQNLAIIATRVLIDGTLVYQIFNQSTAVGFRNWHIYSSLVLSAFRHNLLKKLSKTYNSCYVYKIHVSLHAHTRANICVYNKYKNIVYILWILCMQNKIIYNLKKKNKSR